jgi:hypothetical protein
LEIFSLNWKELYLLEPDYKWIFLARSKCRGTEVNNGECCGSLIALVKEIDISDWE